MAFLLFSLGCKIRFNEKVEAPKRARVSLEDGAKPGSNLCFGDVSGVFQKYFMGTLSNETLVLFFDCANRGLSLFQKYVAGRAFYGEGRTSKVYKPEEVRSFLEKNFLNKGHISDNLAHHVMKIKKMFLGGSLEVITYQELDALKALNLEIQRDLIELNPHLPWVRGAKSVRTDEDGDRLVRAEMQFRKTLRKWGEKVDRQKVPYAFSEFIDFINELNQFSGRSPLTVADKRWVKLVSQTKEVAIGGSIDRINSGEWAITFDRTFRWYMGYLKWQLRGDQVWKFDIEGLQWWRLWIEDKVGLIQESLATHPTDGISFAKIDAVLNTMGEMKLLPATIRLESLRQAYKSFFVYMMGDSGVAPSARKGNSLKSSHIERAAGELLRWFVIQNYILGDRNLSGPVAKLILPSFVTKSGKMGTQDAPEQVKQFLSVTRPLPTYYGTSGQRLWIVPPPAALSMGLSKGSVNNLTWTHLMSTVVRFVMRGYSKFYYETQGWRTGDLGAISESELNRFYTHYALLAADLGFSDLQRGPPMGFLEGNLFTFSGNGLGEKDVRRPKLGLLTGEELSEFLLYTASGIQLKNSMTKAMQNTCAHSKANVFSEACLVKTLQGKAKQLFREMPMLAQDLANSDEGGITIFLRKLLALRKGPQENLQSITETRLATFTMVIQFIETIMVRFDSNSDGILNYDEAILAYPHFRGLINQMATRRGHILDEETLQVIYLWLLEKKTIPDGSLDRDGPWLWAKKIAREYSREDADDWAITRWFKRLAGTKGFVIELRRADLADVIAACL